MAGDHIQADFDAFCRGHGAMQFVASYELPPERAFRDPSRREYMERAAWAKIGRMLVEGEEGVAPLLRDGRGYLVQVQREEVEAPAPGYGPPWTVGCVELRGVTVPFEYVMAGGVLRSVRQHFEAERAFVADLLTEAEDGAPHEARAVIAWMRAQLEARRGNGPSGK